MVHFLRTLAVMTLFMLFVTGCGGTRIALPVSLDRAIEGVPLSGVLSENDRMRWEQSRPGRQRLVVQHRDPEALIKKELARTVVAFTYLSEQTSEVYIRSDDVGYFLNSRNRSREQLIAQGLRNWAEQQTTEEGRE